MTETKSLAEALVDFQRAMPTVLKGQTAKVPTKDGGSYSYKYADLADVMSAAVPVMTQCGLSFTTLPHRTESGAYELEGVLMHISGETVSGSLPLHGQTPQQIGASITYARRYLLGCLTGIVTDEDTDARDVAPARVHTDRPPLVVAQERVMAAYAASHEGDTSLAAIAAHFAAGHDGADITGADIDTLTAYAKSLEDR